MTQLDLIEQAARAARRSAIAANGIPEGDAAVFSDDGVYRYVITRQWDPSRPSAVFCLMNPSVADASKPDPTLTKVVGFAKRVHHIERVPIETHAPKYTGYNNVPAPAYGGIVIVNPYAYVATEVTDLYKAHASGIDVVGPENMEWLERAFLSDTTLPREVKRVYVGWGAKRHPRPEIITAIVALADRCGVELYSFGVNESDGSPKHPLMTAYATPATIWRPRDEFGADLDREIPS